MKKKKKASRIIGTMLIVASLTSIFYWETMGRENYAYNDMVVLNTNVEEGVIITDDMVTTIKSDIKGDIDEIVLSKSDIVNKISLNYIPKNTPIVERYFKERDLVLSNEEYIFKIPDDWIISYPSSLRRGDSAFFYPISDEDSSNLDFDFETVEEEEEQKIIEVKIAYVKDSTNKEVKTIGDNRLDATSNIDSLEIATDIETFEMIEKLREENNKFVIFYK